MSSQGERTIGRTKKAKATLVALICGAALIAAVPGASAAPSYGPNYGGEAPGSGAMNLEFARSAVKTVGPGALVYVKCVGSGTGLCSGTVTLTVAGATHKVPFSVSGGATQALVVPLGSDNPDRGATAVGTTSTAQTLGAFAQSTEVLHFR